jgi:hypothetical protein
MTPAWVEALRERRRLLLEEIAGHQAAVERLRAELYPITVELNREPYQALAARERHHTVLPKRARENPACPALPRADRDEDEA